MEDVQGTDHDSEAENKSVSISKLTPATVQAIYKEMLDTSESMAKFFKPGRIIAREDIRLFCERFQQTCEQYNLKGLKTEFIIRREEDQTERFTSLDRFMASDSGGGRLTAGISIEFSFLIKPPNMEKYQEYKTTMIIDSSDFIEKPDGERFLMNMIQIPTFTFNIDYADYSVARTFIAMTEDWHKSLKSVKTSKTLDYLKNKINPFSDVNIYTNVASFTMTAIASISCLKLLDEWNLEDTNRDLVLFLFYSFIIIYTTRFIAITLCGILFKFIGRYRIPNFIIMNNKDKENFSLFESQKTGITRGITLTIVGFAITIALNILSTHIYNNL